ncbi:hypothetical protein FISHEDRAFT_29812, partial [Fistulina hepatica ATCC 64428]
MNHRDCACHQCCDARDALGCKDPNKCFEKAKQVLDTLPPKWDPRASSAGEAEMEAQPEGENENNVDDSWITFKPCYATGEKVKEIFRIFTDGAKTGNSPPAPQ